MGTNEPQLAPGRKHADILNAVINALGEITKIAIPDTAEVVVEFEWAGTVWRVDKNLGVETKHTTTGTWCTDVASRVMTMALRKLDAAKPS